ncbi:hypothetical protein NMY22_g16119 [Coprinellus aureogranulatus]|nr:hypothetical protein NMY22_g16119 [Coprinellus aureogranulatus]
MVDKSTPPKDAAGSVLAGFPLPPPTVLTAPGNRRGKVTYQRRADEPAASSSSPSAPHALGKRQRGPSLPASLPAKPSKPKRARNEKVKTHEYFTKNFHVRSQPSREIHWVEQTIQFGSFEQLEEALTPQISAEIVYNLQEDCFRMELLALDKALAPRKWPVGDDAEAQDARAKRGRDVREVFPYKPGLVLGWAPKFSTRSKPTVPAQAQGWHAADGDSSRRIRTSHGIVFPHVDVQSSSGSLVQVAQPQPSPTRVTAHTSLLSQTRTPSPRKRSGNKRLRQHQNWTKVMDQLLPEYLALLRDTENLRKQPSREPAQCSCARQSLVEVICVEFDSVVTLTVCACSAARSLVSLGYFPSAPIRPSFAVHLRLLRFVQELHYRTSPNITAVSGALEASLAALGFHFQGQNVVRRKLSQALRYYNLLVVNTDVHTRSRMHEAKGLVEDDGPESSSPEVAEERREEAGEWVDADVLEYLSRCCPLCFSGTIVRRSPVGVEFIVCIDACFTQKRRKPSRGHGLDPPLIHPRTVFLTEAEILAARILVESARPPQPQSQPAPQSQDTMEPGMKLTNSVLDACNESFVAADEKRIKASPQFFAETGLMAMLCRHDQPFFLANMKTAGERQFYAIALITKLFQYLPGNATVGILYDIGCQLDRSCRKWDFLSAFSGRISWGISIFHAYGHQWPCQIVYHPRKRSDFGLSDGEGCERFWSSIQNLIPTLRVSGYHKRIFTIDLQVAWQQEQSRQDHGKWLLRKSHVCQGRLEEAERLIGNAGVPLSALREEWDLQVSTQTRPFVVATAGLAKKAITEILDLVEYGSVLQRDQAHVDEQLQVASRGGVGNVSELLSERMDLMSKRSDANAQVERRMKELGVSDQADLRALMNDKYLQVRVQAKALKDRIQGRLRNKKFELERLNRVYHQASASERRLHEHVSGKFGRSQPSILALVKRYNNFCTDIEKMVQSGTAPAGTIPPKRLDRDNLFSLDVDDPIWDDRGLTGLTADVPLWLGDDRVRDGIRGMLLKDRCDEERVYLQRELTSLVDWFWREWELVETSINFLGFEDDEDITCVVATASHGLLRITHGRALNIALAAGIWMDWRVGRSKECFVATEPHTSAAFFYSLRRTLRRWATGGWKSELRASRGFGKGQPVTRDN